MNLKFLLNRPSSTKRHLLNLLWLALGAVIVWADLWLGPYVRFPVLLVFPIALISWFSGIKSGVFFSLIFPVVKAAYEISLPNPIPVQYLAINCAIQIFALTGLSVLIEILYTQMSEIRVLKGLLPICSYCKNIRTEEKEWVRMEKFISEKSEASFSHGICPECLKIHFGITQAEDSEAD